MSPDLLPLIAAFERVAHHASFTRAASELGVSPSALSQNLRTLEKRLGVRLLDRSTRHVGVTEIGQRFLLSARDGLATLATAVGSLDELRDQPSGLLRLTLSRTAADLVVLPHLTPFLEAYPAIVLELDCDNTLVDLVANGFDAGIRLGENLAQDVVATPLGGAQRLATIAAPRYLKGRAGPRVPQDLLRHRCLNVRLGESLYRWEYARDGHKIDIQVGGALITRDGDTLLSAIRSGAGIGQAFESQVQDDLVAGRLVPVLKPWWPKFPGFYLYHPSRAHIPRKLSAFIDFFRQRLNAEPA
ncbi:LysR family transcriptional regulator [Aquincola sp. J276]|uniref:LysR family transcriptional regulator n=1 Tax=Aquincola sp. J276 TaxID=2898432 RepID=UPI002151F0C8|nr:LysR family transcriptional regulator [Aquincola sp. J276]MCR5868859.1 LysR substrate-binding domain-containing protein [Aquincola sp. J276]